MQVIFSPLYAWARSGLGIWELLPVLPQKQPFFDSQAQKMKKSVETCAKPPAKLEQVRHLFPKGCTVQYHAHTRKSSPKTKKGWRSESPSAITLNLLRNGIILQKGFIIYTGNAKSQMIRRKITETRERPLFRATFKREHEAGRGRKAPANRPKNAKFGLPRK